MNNNLSDAPMTPQERAEKFIPGWSAYTQLACKAIEEAIAAERARVAAEQALPGAPLSEERLQHMRKRLDRIEDRIETTADVPSRERLLWLAQAARDAERHIDYLMALIADLGEDDPGKLAQWQRGRLFGINEGLEEAANKVEEVCLAGAKEQLAASIRILKRHTP